MSDSQDWPDPLSGEYELRVTRQALEDLKARGCSAADLDAIAAASPYKDIVAKFRKARSVDPAGTEAPLSGVHRGDIFKLDGRAGLRAATWHDTEHAVVWLLAVSAEHDFKMLVTRATTGSRKGGGGTNQLMPSFDDYASLDDERGSDWTLEQIETGLAVLVRQARQSPGQRVFAELAATVHVEAVVEAAAAGPDRLHLRFRVPPLKSGVLPSGFNWYLPATLEDVAAATLTLSPFPGEPAPGSLTMSADLT